MVVPVSDSSFFCPFAHGVVAVAGDGVAVFSDFDQAFTAVVAVLPIGWCAAGVDGDVCYRRCVCPV